jgi:predicted nucleotidyltransferase
MALGAQHKQLDEILALVMAVLGTDTVGVYLFGSAVMGGLRPRSDLDILVVSKRRSTREQKGRLVECLLAISARKSPLEGLRPVELTIVVESEIRPWRYPPAFDFQYGEWLRPEFERGDVEPWLTTTNTDLTSLITMVLLVSLTLYGPAPTAIFDPVPPRDFVRAMIAGVDALLGDMDWDTTNVVLTLARIWSSVSTGDVRSKDDAADWALPQLPEEHRAVLALARAIYVGEEGRHWKDIRPRVGPYADYVVGEIDRIGLSHN